MSEKYMQKYLGQLPRERAVIKKKKKKMVKYQGLPRPSVTTLVSPGDSDSQSSHNHVHVYYTECLVCSQTAAK